jgi:hypothetical protein
LKFAFSYKSSKMSKEDFAAIRKAPTGRASVFDVEALLMRDLKAPDKQKKAIPPTPESKFTEAAERLFGNAMPADLMSRMFFAVKTLHHWDDLDPYVLAIAARLVSIFPNGLDTNGQPPSQFLTPRGFQEHPDIGNWVSLIPGDGSELMKIGLRADILAYYKMFFIQ